MQIYKLNTVPNTEKMVLEELKSKFPDVNIVYQKEGVVEFETDNEDLDSFRALLSPLYITDEKGRTRNLFRREWKVDSVPAGVNPSLAYILCSLAQIESGNTVLDPFCGGGTIAITALKYFPTSKVIASDISGKAIDVAEQNFIASGEVKDKYMLFRSNISMLKFPKNYFDRIITNLPFGIRTGSHDQNEKIYKILEGKAKSLLKSGGRIVILTQEKILILNCFHNDEFVLEKSFMIRQGGLTPWIFIYRKV